MSEPSSRNSSADSPEMPLPEPASEIRFTRPSRIPSVAVVLDMEAIARIRLHHGFSAPSMNNLAENLLLTVEEITEAFREDRERHHLDEIRYSAEIGYWCKDHHRTICGICPTSAVVASTERYWERYELSKPVGFPIEVADAMMRLTDICYSLGIDVQQAIEVKMVYNANRPTGHGRKY